MARGTRKPAPKKAPARGRAAAARGGKKVAGRRGAAAKRTDG